MEGSVCKLRKCSTCKTPLAGRTDRYCLECRQHYMRMRAYGLTREEYKALLDKQGNACGVCRVPFTSEPHVDHNHETGEVRGLLCFGCNTSIGKLGDDIRGILRVAVYLTGGAL